MQFTRTIASILALGLALSAMPVHAEGEDAPLPGDFQVAPAAKQPKAKPPVLPPVSASSDKPLAATPSAPASRSLKQARSEVRKPARRSTQPARQAVRSKAGKQAQAARATQRQTPSLRTKRAQAKAGNVTRSKNATRSQRNALRKAPAIRGKQASLKRKKAARPAVAIKKTVKKPDTAKKPARKLAREKK